MQIESDVDWNAEDTLTSAFERTARLYPQRPALLAGSWHPTYDELNATADRLAHALVARGVSLGDRVAILMRPDGSAVAPLLAAWKLGAVGVVLDPRHPPARQRELIADCEPSVLVADFHHLERVGDLAVPNEVLLRVDDHRTQGPAGSPAIHVPPWHTAALVYTSGSSGRPKGVMKTHGQLYRCASVNTEAMGYTADDRVAVFGALGAGDSMTVLCSALINGAMLCPYPLAVRGAADLAVWAVRHGVTAMTFQTSVFRSVAALLPEGFRFEHVRAIRVGGEPVTSADFRLFQRHFPQDAWMVLSFSSSETGNMTWSRRNPHDTVPEGRLPLGPLGGYPATPAEVPETELDMHDEPIGALSTAFERSASVHAARIALFSDRWRPTYGELNATANRVAHGLIAYGVTAGDRVAILMAPDTPAIAAMIAVWKVGGVAVVLDATHPPARLHELVADCEPRALVTDADEAALAGELAEGRCALVKFEAAVAQGPSHDPAVRVLPENTATLVYTSGSTGRPKAVMMTHRQLQRSVAVCTAETDYCAEDRIAVFGAIGAGHFVIRLFCALFNGATLYPYPVANRGMTGLVDWIVQHGITVVACQPSVFRNLMATANEGFRFERVRALRLGGESVTAEDFSLFQRHFPQHAHLVVSLASSEAGHIAWSRRSPHEVVPEGPLAVGHVASRHEVLLLDEEGQPVAPGEVGEIVVRSPYVAAGYWRNPALTAERFSEPLDAAGTRMVRTGDLGRVNVDGWLEYCGRQDDRIKVRGHRIELREVLDAIERLAGIERAMVEAIDRDGHEPALVGFVTIVRGHNWLASDLRRALRRTLPGPMVPSAFVILDTWPLAPSGKVDREALRQLYRQRIAERSIEPPQTPTETLIAGIWSELFETPDISRDDDFFDLGGDSLMATAAAVRVHTATGVELGLAAVIDHSRLAELAALIDFRKPISTSSDDPRPRRPDAGPLPLSPWQERIWTNSQTPASSADNMINALYRIEGPLDVELLRESMDELERRHEMLRTTFASNRGRGAQIVHPPMGAVLSFVDLRGAADPEEAAKLLFARESGQQMDLARRPLLRFVLARLYDSDYRLLRLSHHITSDAESWAIYMRELGAIYEGTLTGRPPPPPPRLQYADYAIWLQARLDHKSPGYRETIEWWKQNFARAPRVFKPPLPPPRDGNRAPDDGWIAWSVASDVSQRLEILGAATGATRLMVRLAAFAALLAAESREREVVIGLYVNLRQRAALANVFGYFVNLAALSLSHDPARSFREQVIFVRDQVAHSHARSEIPYDELQQALEQEGVRTPQVNVIFAQSAPQRRYMFADLKVTRVELVERRYQWGFTLGIDERGDDLDNRCIFDARLYDPAAVRAFLDRYIRLLDLASRHPDRSLRELMAMSQTTLAAAQ